jgi:sugar phosphate isomerase/epimerase
MWPGLKNIFAADSALRTALTGDSAPKMQFPAAARERIAIASYPFREFILGREEEGHGQQRNADAPRGDIVNGASASRRGGKMELKEFAAHVSAKFNIKKIEPWSEHFRSLEKAYLEELRAAVSKAGGAIVNIAVDGEHSPYAADSAERERAIAFSKQWIDAAAAIGSPSVRTNIPQAKDSKPDVERTAASLKRVAEYGAAKNVVVNLENDNPVSEDPFFLVKVIEKVNSEWLHALPDFGNTLAAHGEEYAYKGIEGMFGHAYNISHVKETEVGDGKDKIAHVDLPRTFGIAKKHGYKGYFSMEWDSPGDPYAGTAGLIEKTIQNLS